MTPRDFAFAALDYLPVPATITAATTGQLRRIASDLSAACQIVWTIAPQLYKDRRSVNLLAPQTGTMTVTSGSITFSASTVTIIPGSTVLLSGDTQHNEAVSTTTLRRAYPGSSGSVSFTMWNDAVTIADTDHSVISPVIWQGAQLYPRNNRADFRRRPRPYADYGRRLRPLNATPVEGTPLDYWVDARYHGGVSTRILRLNPMPRTAGVLDYDVTVNAPTISVADLGTDGADSTVTLYVPSQYHETLLRPIFLKLWSASPWFRNDEAVKLIDAQDMAARAQLNLFRVQQQTDRRIYAPI